MFKGYSKTRLLFVSDPASIAFIFDKEVYSVTLNLKQCIFATESMKSLPLISKTLICLPNMRIPKVHVHTVGQPGKLALWPKMHVCACSIGMEWE